MSDKAKILIFDIETRGLVADYGSVFCIGWKWLGEKDIHVKSIHDVPGGSDLDDKALVKWFLSEIWEKADVAVGWYSGPHDEAFLRTRAIIHKLPAPKDVTTLDLWGKVWKRFKFSKNSLDNVARHLGLSQKWYNPTADFEKVLYGDKAAMNRIKKHCARDVEITEQAYERFKSYITTHPRVTHDNWRCRVCGSDKLERRGYSFSAAKGKGIKVHCKSCGAWDTKRVKEVLD